MFLKSFLLYPKSVPPSTLDKKLISALKSLFTLLTKRIKAIKILYKDSLFFTREEFKVMKKRVFTILLCSVMSLSAVSLAACSSADSSAPDSSSSVKRDNDELFADILAGKGQSGNSASGFTLDGDFDITVVNAVSKMNFDEWIQLGIVEQFSYSIELLNMWMYYGDDASIRFQPYEIVDGITLRLHKQQDDGQMIVLDAALMFANPANADSYYGKLGIEKETDDSSADDSSGELPAQSQPAVTDESSSESAPSDVQPVE